MNFFEKERCVDCGKRALLDINRRCPICRTLERNARRRSMRAFGMALVKARVK